MTKDFSASANNPLRRQRFLTEMGIKVQWQSRARLLQEAQMLDVVIPAEVAPAQFQAIAPAAAQMPVTAPTLPDAIAEIATENTTQTAARASLVAVTMPIITPVIMPVTKAGQDLHVKPLIHQPSAASNSSNSAWDDESGVASTTAPAITAKDEGSLAVTSERASAIAAMDWPQLEQAVAQCTACALCKGRKQAVFGVGDKQAKWLLVGEGPGRTEDAQGEPFVGKSGKLLDNMLASLDLKRGQNVYIANIVKCRPSDASGNDRPPSEEEASACRPFLERQIALLQPKLILALGKTAAVSLLQRDPQTAVASLRGKVQQVNMPVNMQANNVALPVVVTYHPAYLLRKPSDKAKAWADLCLAQQQYDQA